MTPRRILACSLLIAALALAGLTACGKQRRKYTNLAQLEKGTFAVPTGTAGDTLVKKKFPGAGIVYFNTAMDCCLALKSGKADAAAYDLPVLRNIVAKVPELNLLPDLLTVDKYGFAFRKESPDLKQAFDTLVQEMRQNGEYAKMEERWLPKVGNPGAMPPIEESGANGVLKFGTAAVVEPFTYVGPGNQPTGLDIELARRLAAKLGKKLEIVNMEFGSMIPGLISGKVDMIGACITITEERAKSVLFSEPYFDGGIAAVVLK